MVKNKKLSIKYYFCDRLTKNIENEATKNCSFSETSA